MGKAEEFEESVRFLRKTSLYKSTIVIIVMASVILFQGIKFSDRYTRSDHNEYVVEHDAEVKEIVLSERAAVQKDFDSQAEKLDELVKLVAELSGDMKAMNEVQRLMLRKLDMNGDG